MSMEYNKYVESLDNLQRLNKLLLINIPDLYTLKIHQSDYNIDSTERLTNLDTLNMNFTRGFLLRAYLISGDYDKFDTKYCEPYVDESGSRDRLNEFVNSIYDGHLEVTDIIFIMENINKPQPSCYIFNDLFQDLPKQLLKLLKI